MTSEKIIIKLQNLIKKGESIQTQEVDYDSWCDIVVSSFATIFGDSHFQTKKFETISKPNYLYTEDILNYQITLFKKSKDFIENIIEQIQDLGIEAVKGENKDKPLKSGNTINISQNQSQNQEQSQSISFEIFLDAIKTELDEDKQKQLKKVLTEYQTTSNFTKVIKHFKSLGENILANLISTIILNPNIISQIITQLPK